MGLRVDDLMPVDPLGVLVPVPFFDTLRRTEAVPLTDIPPGFCMTVFPQPPAAITRLVVAVLLDQGNEFISGAVRCRGGPASPPGFLG